MFKKGKKKPIKQEVKEEAQDNTETIEAKEVAEGEEIEEVTHRDKLINNYSTYRGLFEADNIASLDVLITETKQNSLILMEQNQKLDKLIELMTLATQE